VGPSGALLDRALDEAGIDRRDAYVTNAVKHFKWVQRGKRRLHQKPNAGEIRACAPWLEAEVAAVRPELLVALGATGAQALFGRSFRVLAQRGQVLNTLLGLPGLGTVHPSSILRAPDEGAHRLAYRAFVEDLSVAAAVLGGR